jgi:hypothetical protein
LNPRDFQNHNLLPVPRYRPLWGTRVLKSIVMPRNKSSPKGITESAAVNPISIGWALSVADHLSFRGAARELGVRQTAVSRRVGALENALGVSLFERGHRGLKITTAGFRFIQDVREGFRYIEHATRMAGAAGLGKSGRLSICIQPSMGAGFFRELFGPMLTSTRG